MRGSGQIAELCGDRRARGRRDHQRRPGPRRAARLARGDRRGQGRDPRGACRRTAGRCVPADAEALRAAPRATRSRLLTLRPGRRRLRHRAIGRRGRDEALIATPAGEADFHFPFAEAHNLTNALAPIAVGVALGPRPRGDGRRALRDSLLAPARRAPRAPRAGSSSSTTATTPTRSRCARRSTTSRRRLPASTRGRRPRRRGARRDGRARPRRPRLPPRGRRACRERGDRPLIGVGEPARDYEPDELGRRRRRGGRRRRRAAAARATRSWSRARARSGWSGDRRPARPLRRGWRSDRARADERPEHGLRRSGDDPDRRDGGDADHHLPRPEVHRVPARARVRPAHPRGRARRSTTPRPARRRWAG